VTWEGNGGAAGGTGTGRVAHRQPPPARTAAAAHAPISGRRCLLNVLVRRARRADRGSGVAARTRVPSPGSTGPMPLIARRLRRVRRPGVVHRTPRAPDGPSTGVPPRCLDVP